VFLKAGLTTPHGMFDRSGGVSSAPYVSCNLSYRVGDAPENVRRNRERIKDKLGIDTLVSAEQIHGDAIYCVEGGQGDVEVEGYDALITDKAGIGLLIQQADCQAVLLHDPDNRAVAAIHCGWRGNVLDIAGKTVQRMQVEYRSDPAKIQAVISPSLGPCCGEFIHYRRELPIAMHNMRIGANHFDFWKITALQLADAGVPEDQIEIMGICTACNADFFSYRRSRRQGKPLTGRQGSIIILAP